MSVDDEIKIKVYDQDKEPAFNRNRPGIKEVDLGKGYNDILKRCTEMFYGQSVDNDSFYERYNGPENKEVPVGTVGILFTGGMDSTLLASRALRAGKYVLPIVNLFNCESLQFNLLAAITWRQLHEKYGRLMLHPCFCLRNISCGVVAPYFSGMLQQPINMFSLGFIPEPTLNNLESVQAGFVKGDDAIRYIPEMRRLYKSVWKLSHATKHPGHNHIPFTPLLFPLQDTEKADIKKELDSYGDGLHTLSCEDPAVDIVAWDDGYGVIRISECNRCHSCCRKAEYGHETKSIDIGFKHDMKCLPDNA